MRQANATPASSGWEWGSGGPSTPGPPHRRPSRPGRGSVGAIVAAVVFLGVTAAVAAYIFVPLDDSDEPVATTTTPKSESDETSRASSTPSSAAPKPDPADAGSDVANRDDGVAMPAPAVRSLDQVAWTTDVPSTLQELARTWSIQRSVLTQLNPDLSPRKQIDAGVPVIVYSQALGESFSLGPPNNGRLTRGVPLPEDDAWLLPEDRSRAFATTETITSLTAALDAYRQRFPDAEPIQLGDLSARRGGKIYGHQSHQTGLDVDIRLVRDAAGDGFDANRNWFLIKTLVDGGDVTAIFLNATEQRWLRSAAEADVGTASAVDYFALIMHEPGHTIHTHIRFACPKQNKRCVPYPLPDTDEQDTKKKLPTRLGKTTRGTIKLPRTSTKRKGRVPTKTKGR